MTHAVNSTVIEGVMELLTREGFAGCPEALQILLNEAMKAERSAALGAGPHERTPQRRGYANGYKDKTVATRLGSLALQVPQVRGDVTFYPSALERGVRSERALKLAVVEMYVQVDKDHRLRAARVIDGLLEEKPARREAKAEED